MKPTTMQQTQPTPAPADDLRKVVGWKEICAEIGVKYVAKARALAERERDPLPIEINSTQGVWAYAYALRAWCRRDNKSYKSHIEMQRVMKQLQRTRTAPARAARALLNNHQKRRKAA